MSTLSEAQADRDEIRWLLSDECDLCAAERSVRFKALAARAVARTPDWWKRNEMLMRAIKDDSAG